MNDDVPLAQKAAWLLVYTCVGFVSAGAVVLLDRLLRRHHA